MHGVNPTIKKGFKIQVVALMREKINAYTILVGKPEEREHLSHPRICG
jgi:hypothetical protein